MKIENKIEKNVITTRDKIREHFHSEFQKAEISKSSIDLVETWNRFFGDKVFLDCSRVRDKNEWKSHQDPNEREVTHGKDGANEKQRFPASQSIIRINYKKYLGRYC